MTGMTMVERVARAMAVLDSGPEGSVIFTFHWAEFGMGYNAGARAAIAAMREPTEAMLTATEETSSYRGCDPAMIHAESERTWETMIDTALSEGGEG